MGDTNRTGVSRRAFVRRVGSLAGGVILGAGAAVGSGEQPAPSEHRGEIARRVLGKTKASVSVLALGTGYAGLCPAISNQQIARMVGTALELGINYVDTARIYGNGEVDVLMMPINFVDRYTYAFQEKVLPLARKHNLGVVAMKVYGGAQGRIYTRLNQPPELDRQYLGLAMRYALGIAGVAAVNIGVENIEQIRRNVEAVKAYRALSAEEDARLAKLGRRLASEWGEHFGPVAEQSG